MSWIVVCMYELDGHTYAVRTDFDDLDSAQVFARSRRVMTGWVPANAERIEVTDPEHRPSRTDPTRPSVN